MRRLSYNMSYIPEKHILYNCSPTMIACRHKGLMGSIGIRVDLVWQVNHYGVKQYERA